MMALRVDKSFEIGPSLTEKRLLGWDEFLFIQDIFNSL
jgi:hypothetical protein